MGLFRRHGLFASNLLDTATGPLYTFDGNNGKSYIDYISLPEVMKANVSGCHVGEPHILNNSDHLPVFSTMNVGSIALTTCEYNAPPTVNWGKLNLEDRLVKYEHKLLPEVESVIERLTNTTPSIELVEWAFSTLTDTFNRVSADLPRCKFKRHLKPYWNDQLSVLKSLKVKSYRTWVASGRPRDHDNTLFIEYKRSKKTFSSYLSKLARQYENKEVVNAVKTAEINRNAFWKLVQRSRKSLGSKSFAIKRPEG